MVVLVTDNLVVERTLQKGDSSSKNLFELVLRLKGVELTYGCKILVTHVSGSRIIFQGTKVKSRMGRLDMGVSPWESMIRHCPCGKTAIGAQPKLLEELYTWNQTRFAILKPRDWFELGHDIHAWRLGSKSLKYPMITKGYYLWVPLFVLAMYQ